MSAQAKSWGYPRLQVGGLSVLSRCSDGSITLASYHPRSCPTWHWSIGLTKRQPHLRKILTRTPKRFRYSQWHDYLKLPFGWALSFSFQDFHKGAR